MSKYVRALFVCFLCVLGFGNTAYAVENGGTPETSDLVNEAGRLRMLTERMGKAYAQIALSVLPDKAGEQIKASETQFDDNLAFLAKGATTVELKSDFAAVSSSYKLYQQALAKPASKTNVAAAHLITDKLVAEADVLTTAFAAQGHLSTARIVNMAGRQRMLSQRMARLYFAAALSGGKAETERYRIEFKSALASMEAAPLSSSEIKREIELAKAQWLFFEQALMNEGGVTNRLKNVATTSDRLLEMMDGLTMMYVKSLKAVVGSLMPSALA
jgi:hypothetical protein